MVVIHPMFPTTATKEFCDILIGRRHRRMINSLERIFDLGLQNSLIAYLTGDPGSGKSHTVLHLQHLCDIQKNRYMFIIRADLFTPSIGNPLTQASILSAIYNDQHFLDLAKSVNIDVDLTRPLDIKSMSNGINALRTKLEENAKITGAYKPIAFVIAIDGLDEYVRPSGNENIRKFDTKQFMLDVRFLLESLERTTFLLTLTSSIYDEIDNIMKEDRTFMRRSICPQEYDGTNFSLAEFTFDETIALYNEYKNRWLNLELRYGNINQDCYVKLQDLDWPINSEALLLAYEATRKLPRALLNLFQLSFERLRLEFPSEWSGSTISMDLTLMAREILIAASRAETGIDISNVELKRRLELLSDWKRILDSISNSPTTQNFTDVFINLLRKKNFQVSEKDSEGLSTSKIHILQVSTGGSSGFLGVLPLLNEIPSEEDFVKMGRLVADSVIHQIFIVTSRDDFSWIYSSWPDWKPKIFNRPRERHLGNYSYTIKLDNSQIKGIVLTSQAIGNANELPMLWIVDRLSSPIKGYQLSTMLSAMAHAAIAMGG